MRLASFTHLYEAMDSSIPSVEFGRSRLILKGMIGKSSMSYQYRILRIFHFYWIGIGTNPCLNLNHLNYWLGRKNKFKIFKKQRNSNEI